MVEDLLESKIMTPMEITLVSGHTAEGPVLLCGVHVHVYIHACLRVCVFLRAKWTILMVASTHKNTFAIYIRGKAGKHY